MSIVPYFSGTQAGPLETGEAWGRSCGLHGCVNGITSRNT
jgi:hypothetical protein